MAKYKTWIFLSLSALFWAGNFVFGSLVVMELTPVGLIFIRWFFASILLLIIAQKVEKPDWKELVAQWPKILGLSLFGLIGYNLFLYYALYYTSPLNASLVNSFNPVLIAIVSAFYLKEKISKHHLIGIIISFFGVFVVLTKGNLLQAFEIEYNLGDLLVLGAVIVWSIYSMIGKKLTSLPPITSTAASALLAAIILLPFVIYMGIDYTNISRLSVIGIVYIIFFPSVCSYIFWNIGIREVEAGKAGIFLNLMPVFTAIISWIMGQTITGVQLIGGSLVFLGVYITTRLGSSEETK